MHPVNKAISIGGALLDAERGTLRRADGVETTLRPKSLELLLLLLRQPGRTVSRGDILDAVWPGLHVTDDSITQCVMELRRALGDDGALLKTVPRRGLLLEVGSAEAPAQPRCGGVPIVAIMPLRVAADDRGLASFADGVLEGVVGALSRLREPMVISANSTRQIGGLALAPREIGERLGAGYIASGSLRRGAQRMRLNIELAEAETGTVLWQRSFDLEQDATIEAEDMVAGVITHSLAPRVNEAELRRGRRQAPGDRAAYHLLLEARLLIFRMEREAFEDAGDLLRRVVAMDPSLASAHATIADWHSLRIGQGWSPDREADSRALAEAVEVAVRLDADNARALALLGHNHTILHRRYDAALMLFERALDSAPNDAEAWMWTSPTFAWMGQGREAVRRAEHAIRLSPADPLLFRYEHFLSIGHYAAGDFAAAAEWGLRSRAANPNYTSNLRVTAASLAAMDNRAEARRLGAEVMALDPDFRVGPMIALQAFRDETARLRFGQQLIEAGMPA